MLPRPGVVSLHIRQMKKREIYVGVGSRECMHGVLCIHSHGQFIHAPALCKVSAVGKTDSISSWNMASLGRTDRSEVVGSPPPVRRSIVGAAPGYVIHFSGESPDLALHVLLRKRKKSSGTTVLCAVHFGVTWVDDSGCSWFRGSKSLDAGQRAETIMNAGSASCSNC